MTSFSSFSWGSSAVGFTVPGGPPPQQAPYIVYVSTSGSDGNDGMSPATPKATLAAGKALMRNGLEDQLLLKRGDTWTEALGNWTTSGRLPLRPQVIGAYGTGVRPIVRTGTSNGLVLSVPVTYLTVENLQITAHTYNGSSGTPAGIKVAETCNGLRVQGCYLNNLTDGVRVDPPVTAGHIAQNVTIYRNVFADIYAAVGANCNGVYLARTFTGHITDNVFSKIGEVDPGPLHYGVYVRSGFSYNCDLIDVSFNQFLEVAGEAVLNRSSRFTAFSNMISKAGVGFGMRGLDPIAGNTTSGIINSQVQLNCITEGRDTNGSNARGWGFAFEHCGDSFGTSSITWHNNLMVDHGTSTDPHPLVMWPTYPPASGLMMSELWTNGNVIYEWQGSCKINEHPTNDPFRTHSFDNAKVYSTGSHYVFEHNLDNGSRWNVGACHLLSGSASGVRYRYNGSDMSQATWKTHLGNGGGGTDEVIGPSSFPDVTRTIATYDTVVGGAGTFADFVTLVRGQTLGNWRPELGGAATALWIRQGFGFSN